MSKTPKSSTIVKIQEPPIQIFSQKQPIKNVSKQNELEYVIIKEEALTDNCLSCFSPLMKISEPLIKITRTRHHVTKIKARSPKKLKSHRKKRKIAIRQVNQKSLQNFNGKYSKNLMKFIQKEVKVQIAKKLQSKTMNSLSLTQLYPNCFQIPRIIKAKKQLNSLLREVDSINQFLGDKYEISNNFVQSFFSQNEELLWNQILFLYRFYFLEENWSQKEKAIDIHAFYSFIIQIIVTQISAKFKKEIFVANEQMSINDELNKPDVILLISLETPLEIKNRKIQMIFEIKKNLMFKFTNNQDYLFSFLLKAIEKFNLKEIYGVLADLGSFFLYKIQVANNVEALRYKMNFFSSELILRLHRMKKNEIMINLDDLKKSQLEIFKNLTSVLFQILNK